MKRSETAFLIVSGFWAFIGIVCPLLVQFCMGKSANKGVVQLMFVMTAVCCYLFWFCAFLFQLNPLIGPKLESNLIRVMQYEWDGIDPTHIHHGEA
ncbi:hypothetical protein ACF0H5_009662 [Mactra antiquata]